jgi:type IV secretion system protein VirB5
MKHLKRLIAAAALTAAVGSANAGIPVIDVANLAQAVEQVIAWGQQYSQMVQQIDQMRAQYAQLQSTYNSMTGNRGLGTLLNGAVDQAARRYLPADGTQIGQLSSGVAGFGALQATINGYKTTVTSLPTTWFSVGTTAANTLASRVNSLATQRAVGEAAYTSNAQRTADLENMISTIGMATDPKAIAEINARITAQQALIANESTRLQALSYMQELERQQNEQRAREVVSTWSTYVMPPISF